MQLHPTILGGVKPLLMSSTQDGPEASYAQFDQEHQEIRYPESSRLLVLSNGNILTSDAMKVSVVTHHRLVVYFPKRFQYDRYHLC